MPKDLWKCCFSSSLLQPVPVPLYRSRMPRYKNNTPSPAFSQSQSERFKFMVAPFRLSIRTMVPAFVGDKIKKVPHDGNAEEDTVDQRCNRCEG